MKTRAELYSLIITDINTNSNGEITAAKVRNILDETVDSYVHKDDKDATGGVPGLTLFKINFKNAANTFTSFFTNSNTAARTYTFQNRNGTIADDTDLALKSDKLIVENAQTGTGYTLVLTDADKLLTTSNAAANTMTIPPNSSVAFSVGTQIVGMQLGAGQTSIVAGAGVTILSSGGKLKCTGQYSGYTLIKKSTDTWLLMGDIAL